jgi:hypothetical protein
VAAFTLPDDRQLGTHVVVIPFTPFRELHAIIAAAADAGA